MEERCHPEEEEEWEEGREICQQIVWRMTLVLTAHILGLAVLMAT